MAHEWSAVEDKIQPSIMHLVSGEMGRGREGERELMMCKWGDGGDTEREREREN